jgi:hypothetical protein
LQKRWGSRDARFPGDMGARKIFRLLVIKKRDFTQNPELALQSKGKLNYHVQQ